MIKLGRFKMPGQSHAVLLIGVGGGGRRKAKSHLSALGVAGLVLKTSAGPAESVPASGTLAYQEGRRKHLLL